MPLKHPQNQLNDICIVATNDVYGMSVMQAKDMLHSASLRLNILQKGPERESAFNVAIANLTGDDILTYSGTVIKCDHKLSLKDHWRLIILGHFWSDTDKQRQENPGLIDWLKAQHYKGTEIIAQGTSVFWLAEAGILDGKEATTYWRTVKDYKKHYPNIIWREHQAITESENISCVAGAASAADLLLHKITQICGLKVAQGISRDIFFESTRSYTIPILGLEAQRTHNDLQIQKIQDWLDDHYHQELEFAFIAQQFGMSLRNFSRRFALATQLTPIEYLQQLRIHIAKHQLIYSQHSVKHIALDVGYQDASYFSQLFKRYCQLTPLQFRKKFKIPG